MPYMYILRCEDGTLFTGSTWDLSRRMGRADDDRNSIQTAWRSPVELVYAEWFDRIDEAFYRERQVHAWRRSRKERLIAEGHVGDIPPRI